MTPFVSIVILNWNNWADTLECLESVLKLDYANFNIILCDNGSQDGSIEKFKLWASNRLSIIPKSRHFDPIVLPPSEKKEDSIFFLENKDEPVSHTTFFNKKLFCIPTGKNLGCAGGNNIGARFAIEKGADYIWILNNDTVVKRDSLARLVEKFQLSQTAGICGSLLLYYHLPTTVQAYGGAVFFPPLAYAKHIGSGKSIMEAQALFRKNPRLDYVTGAMLVSKQFIETIGYMNEDYFLYYEEIDWATRAKGKFSIIVAPESIVYHQEGGTTGGNTQKKQTSVTALYHGIRSRHLFIFKYYPQYFIFVYSLLFKKIITALVKRQWQTLKIAFNFLIHPFGSKTY